jgi:alkylation response protein AidB-like acyl-CoA dehydrogenase
MTHELQEIRELAHDFAAAELRPHSERWDGAAALDDDVMAKVAELGFFGMLTPESDGGMGFDLATWAAALQELAWGEPAVALVVAQSAVAADLIARHGSAAQREQWLGALAAGEAVACIAFAEDGDVLQTRVERSGEGWRLRGRKRWVTYGDRAALALVLADSDDGAALVIVPRESGYRAGPPARTLGMKAVALVDLEFDGDIPADNHVGTVGQDADDDVIGRISAAAIAVGIARAALEHAIRYAGEREQFGRPIRSFDAIRHKLADMAARTAAAGALLEQACARPEDATMAAMAKLVAAECAMFVTTEAVQVFGGYGYMRDYPVEKLMRDAKATQIIHGVGDVLRLRIADALHT